MHRKKLYFGKILAALFIALVVAFSALGIDAYADGKLRNAKVGFFEYSGYHEIDAQNRRIGYGEDFFRLMQRYTNLRYEYLDVKTSWD